MFAWGANSHAQLGLGYATEQIETPLRLTEVPFGVGDIECIAAGGGHTLVGTQDGRLYGCGWNNRGQLGLGHLNDCVRFEPVGEFGFRRLYAGWDTSAGVNESGELFVWGSNVWQQIGVASVKSIATPTQLPLPETGPVVHVAFGLQYMAVLMESGKVWVLGKCKFLKDYPLESSSKLTIRCLWDKGPVREVVSGDNHLALLTGDRRIECLGDAKHGQSLSENVLPEDVMKLESGWTHSACLTVNGTVYLWGRNNYGQLGQPGPTSSSCPQKLCLETEDMVLKDVRLGSQHGAAVTRDGRVYCWGWNEHGNCGTGGTENV
uniref:RCC1-like domain-containing protein n=1 Tax=Anopheles epiroticus TaxID=199890 RepID=A0A182PCP5_9DIPT